MSTMQAQAAVMERTATQFEQVNAGLQAMLTRLMGQLEMMGNQWQGAGGRSFTQVMQAWRADQEALQRSLSETATAIRTAGRHYEAADAEAAQRVTRAGAATARLELPL